MLVFITLINTDNILTKWVWRVMLQKKSFEGRAHNIIFKYIYDGTSYLPLQGSVSLRTLHGRQENGRALAFLGVIHDFAQKVCILWWRNGGGDLQRYKEALTFCQNPLITDRLK